MVGDPKTLYDLRKIDADVQIRCRACGHRRIVDREWLIGEFTRRKKSLEWVMIEHQLRCTKDGCSSRTVELRIMPFAGQTEPPAILAAFLE